jgi:hypothetical protein
MPEECEAKVWFLTGGYQGPITTRSFIPPGKFYILAPLYSAWASTEEYPSLNSRQELNDFCAEDLKDSKVQGTLDGRDIASNHIKVEEPFRVNLPEENVLGLKLRGKKKTINIVSNGHWVWLKPLSIGDHRLHLTGSTPRFVSELTISLSVAGPK